MPDNKSELSPSQYSQNENDRNSVKFVPSFSQMEKEQNNDVTGSRILSNQETDLPQEGWFSFFKRRWAIILGVTCGISTAVAWWTFQQSPIYQGKFMILVEKQNSVNNQNQANQQLPNQLNGINGINNNSIDSGVDYSTEVQILGSASVLAPILEEIAKEYPEIYQDFNFSDLQDLEIRQVDRSKIIEVVFKDENPEKVKFVLDKIAEKYLDEDVNPLTNNDNDGLKFVRSQTKKLEAQVNDIQNKIQTLKQKHNLIDPQITAKELTQQYLLTEKQYFEATTKLEQAKITHNKLQEQLKLSTQEAIAITSLTESARYQSLLKQLEEVDIELAKQSAIYTDISPNIIELREKRGNILDLLQEEADKFNVVALPNQNNEIPFGSPNKIRSQLTEQLIKTEQDIENFKAEVKNINIVLADFKLKINQMPEITREYSDLKRELDVSTDSLTRLLKTREQLEVENIKNRVNWQIISPPQLDEEPIFAFAKDNLIFVLVGSLVVGTVSGAIADEWDDRIHSLWQLKQIIKQPILGCIPFHNRFASVVNHTKGDQSPSSSWFGSNNSNQDYPSFTKTTNNSTNTNTSESIDRQSKKALKVTPWENAFRRLYGNLYLGQNKQTNKSIVISSANPAVGKSSISFNLAMTAAKIGKRVLLVDSDLRRPQMHKWTQLDNNYGLSDVITAKMPLAKAIRKVDGLPSLSVLTAGQPTIDVTRLLLSSNMNRLIDILSTSSPYDLIIYDTPALLGFVDAKIIASHTNGLVLVTQVEKTETKALKQVKEQLGIAKIPLLGVIANGVKNKEYFAYQKCCQKHYGN